MIEPRFLFDSNICIYVVEGVGDPLRARIEECDPREIVTSSIAYAEVMRGIRPDDAKRNARAERLFALFDVLPFDRKAAHCYRAMPFRRDGFDRLIGAHALSLGLTLVTNNERHFADIDGLKVENWTLPE